MTGVPTAAPPRPDPWFACETPRPEAAVRLFCLPFAGGSAHLYRGWPAALPRSVEVCPVQLPGRMSRLGEPPFRSAEAAAEALVDALLPRLDRPFALFGHSMGALLCFEAARGLRRRGLPAPARLLLSAHRAPHRPSPEPPYHHLPDPEFLDRVGRLGGIPPEVLAHRELLDLMMPVLRADLELCQTYGQAGDGEPLDVAFTLFAGRHDALAGADEMAHWARHTRASTRLHVVEGGHFFLTAAPSRLLDIVARDLCAIVGEARDGPSGVDRSRASTARAGAEPPFAEREGASDREGAGDRAPPR